jgi:diguanylate cyclase (GGDEF)-like protein
MNADIRPSWEAPLQAADALRRLGVVRVHDSERPPTRPRPAQDTIFAVFSESSDDAGHFLGLVSGQDAAAYPHRIFADLIGLHRIEPVPADMLLEDLGQRIARLGLVMVPVLDEQQRFIGVATRTSLLEALLTRQQELLEQTRRLNHQIEQDRQRKASWAERLQGLHDATRQILRLLSRTTVEQDLLQGGIEALAHLMCARYGAIGLLDAQGHLHQFMHTGLTTAQAQRIGAPPQGHGLLGVVIQQDVSLRIDDLSADPRSAGFPAHHPVMTSLLAVPISQAGKVFGRIYLCDKIDGTPFTAEDELLAGSFASSLSLVIDNARRLEEVQHTRLRLDRVAHFDELTGLPNRALFHERLEQALGSALRDGRSLSVLFLDLDNFKLINDTRGHELGDQLLEKVAERLRHTIGGAGLIARMGGDEFTVLLGPDEQACEPERAAQVAREVLAALHDPFDLQGERFFLGASIGIAIAPQDASTPTVLIRQADTAMYHAKARGRNNLQFFTPNLDQAIQRRMHLEARLREALDAHHFELHFQPQVDLVSGRLIGAEALLRWPRPEDGQITTPDQFIPVAEETGLIVPLGEWVLRQACEQAARWQHAGQGPLRIAVNLSAEQFRHADLPRLVREVLDSSGLSPDLLELEITESLLIQDDASILTAMEALRAQGVHFAVDDFGTGYSSLSYIRNFPVETIKIDQSFIRHGVGDPSATALIEAIIAMAASLNLRVVAEGVETPEQLALLRSLHCGHAQGYLFGRAMPAAEFAALLHARTQGEASAR